MSLKLYNLLADKNIRLFNICCGSDRIDEKTFTLIHENKTVEQWQKDVLNYKNESTSNAIGSFLVYLKDLGYIPIDEMASDTYFCSVSIELEKIITDETLECFDQYE